MVKVGLDSKIYVADKIDFNKNTSVHDFSWNMCSVELHFNLLKKGTR